MTLFSGEVNASEVWVSVSLKKNLGNYESLGIDAGARISVKAGDGTSTSREDREAAFKQLWEEVEAQIEDRLNEAGLKKGR